MANVMHAEVIGVLHELYALLDNLAFMTCGLCLPPADTGVHPSCNFNAAAARAAGYDADAISLMTVLPYLDIQDNYGRDVELVPSTYPITYLGQNKNKDAFEDDREILDEELMAPTALRLTTSEGGHGPHFIYDTETKLIHVWTPMADGPEPNHYSNVPAISPREALGPIIENWRNLRYIGMPNLVYWEHDQYYDCSDGHFPPHYSELEIRRARAGWNVRTAVDGVKDLYIDCGWDVDSLEQAEFRRDEFLKRRAQYWKQKVEPLLDIESYVCTHDLTHLRDAER